MKPKKNKKRNPADDTGRNRRATRKKILTLASRVAKLESDVGFLSDALYYERTRINGLEHAFVTSAIKRNKK